MSFDVRVCTLAGNLHQFTADAEWTALHVKSAIETATGIGREAVSLLSGVEELEDVTSLHPYVVDAVLELTLIRRAMVPQRAEWFQALSFNPSDVRLAPESVRCDRELMLMTVGKQGSTLEHVAGPAREDEDIVFAAVQSNPRALEFAGRWRADAGLVTLAVRRDAEAIVHVTQELRVNRDIAMLAVNQKGLTLRHLSPELRSEKGVILAAVRQNGMALLHVAEELRSEDVMLAAVRQTGLALRFLKDSSERDWSAVSSGLVSDQVIMAAVSTSGAILADFPPELQDNRDLAVAAVRSYPHVLEKLPQAARADKAIVLAAVERMGWAVKWAAPELVNDREVAIAAVGGNYGGLALQYLPGHFLADRELILVAVRRNRSAFQWAVAELQADPEVRHAAGKPRQERWLSGGTAGKGGAPGGKQRGKVTGSDWSEHFGSW